MHKPSRYVIFYIRLYARAVFSGYRRGKSTQHQQQALVKIEGVHNKTDANWYLGKRVVYQYTGGKRPKVSSATDVTKKPKHRAIAGKVIAIHGNSGSVRAKFLKNLPPQAIGKKLRVVVILLNSTYIQVESKQECKT